MAFSRKELEILSQKVDTHTINDQLFEFGKSEIAPMIKQFMDENTFLHFQLKTRIIFALMMGVHTQQLHLGVHTGINDTGLNIIPGPNHVPSVRDLQDGYLFLAIQTHAHHVGHKSTQLPGILETRFTEHQTAFGRNLSNTPFPLETIPSTPRQRTRRP